MNDASVSVDNDTLDLFVEDTYAINATTVPAIAILLNLTYTSSNVSVATVDENGTVTAVGEGTAIITVTVGDDKIFAKNSTEVSVTVSKIPTEIIVENATIEMKVTDEIDPVVSILPSDAGELDFTSSDVSVVTVNGIGTITAVGEGNATVTVSFMGNDKYAASNATISVTVTLKDASVVADPDSLDLLVGETGQFYTTTTPDDLDIKVSSSNESVATVKLVNRVPTVTAVAEGSAVITVTINEKDYVRNSTTVAVKVVKIPTDILIENHTLDMEISDVANPVVSLMPSNAGNLSFMVSDPNVILVNGHGIVTAIGEGNATVTVSFRGNDKYLPSNATITVTVSKATIQPEAATNDTTVSVYVPEDAMGNINLTAGNETFTAPIENGVATFDVSNLLSGDYNATISYPGDDKYEGFEFEYPISIEEQFTITADNLTKYYHGSERFAVNLTDGKGNPIANATVNININGASYNRTTDSNGQASMAINLNSGEYPAVVSYNGTSVDTTITVLPTVNGTDVVKMYRNGTQYYATFLNSEGNYLADGTEVTFNINGVMYKRYINGTEGKARLNINLEQGEYVLTAINPETGEMASNNITVLPVLTENKDVTKYYRNATQYTVKVLGEDGNPVGENVTVKFNINGVFYERPTNASGIAKLNLNLQPGDYVITAEYNGCRVSNNITILPVLNATDISMKYRDGTQFKANLVDGQGNPYVGQNVTFNVNGVFYNRVTDSNGQAKLNINLMAGEYIITSSYNGANIANKITIRG